MSLLHACISHVQVKALKAHPKEKAAGDKADKDKAAEKARWEAIASLVPGKSAAACMRRYKALREAYRTKEQKS